MKFYPEKIYHVYNRGNDKQPVFFERDHYLFFIRKLRRHLTKHCHILAYCLIPNHFHILIYTNKAVVSPTPSSGSDQRLLALSSAFGKLLSSYTKGVNKEMERTGSLFQQKTKAKLLSWDTRQTTLSRLTNKDFYPLTCFHYIHQNPIKSKLTKDLNEWEFSSFLDYAGLRNGTLCNKSLATELLGLPKNKEQFYKESYQSINETIAKTFFEKDSSDE